ncbi:ribonuclease CAF1 [Microstroma glucosiphilum]|uniref:poly(A)-specific ribonuclease n=1 Tax=Pseudomicrostroma glucosiphilum TaxID=1684307 RepID=A0A316U7B2_9BASI|nr:ribonuclease CAF1 [Pseudomicrostroma glucosiphilum]PWN21127.1 ribonuclease CAF1 [Pseudomicrostroma glucosiphilum]
MANQIREVWAENLEVEMVNLRDMVERYPYVAMDTEFPGIVARPIGTFKGSSDYHYQTLRCNVDLLRLIQLGITLSDENGRYPSGVSTWQFNFRFSTHEDMCAPESLELLNKAGLDFDRHERLGIDVEYFGELLITSGLALFDQVKWVSFHSGYDFGYLVKVVSCAPLPSTEAEFFQLLRIWFPSIYDIKYLMRSCKNLKGGLQDVAEELGVARIGQQHQAGSDSLLTAATFFKLRSRFFEGVIDDAKFIASSRMPALGSANSSNNAPLPPSRDVTAGGL